MISRPKHTRRPRYVVDGDIIRGPCGLIEYDFIEDPEEARLICEILNRGIGPDWDAVSAEIERLKAAKINP